MPRAEVGNIAPHNGGGHGGVAGENPSHPRTEIAAPLPHPGESGGHGDTPRAAASGVTARIVSQRRSPPIRRSNRSVAVR